MKIEDKKLTMADKMYKQNGTGGIGKNPKDYQNGKETKKSNKDEKYEMNGKTTGFAKGQKYFQADKKGSFKDKYEMADHSGSMKGGYKM